MPRAPPRCPTPSSRSGAARGLPPRSVPGPVRYAGSPAAARCGTESGVGSASAQRLVPARNEIGLELLELTSLRVDHALCLVRRELERIADEAGRPPEVERC